MNKHKEKVSFFIDGYNLFYGLKTLPYKIYRWLDIQKLCGELINPTTQEIASIHYFTTRVFNNPTKEANQEKYLTALSTLSKVIIYYGEYKNKEFQCPNCQKPFTQPIEKITDVNISVLAMLKAHLNEYDVACFITGDTDLTPTMSSVANDFNKDVRIAFPPGRATDKIKNMFPGKYRHIRERILQKCILPTSFYLNNGHLLECPRDWQRR